MNRIPLPSLSAALCAATFSTVAAQRVIATVPGISASDLFGYAVAALGDIDGDGVADFVAGCPGNDYGTAVIDRGLVQVVSGRDGRRIHFVVGARAGMRLGTSVAALGDVDRDGVPDFAAGGPDDQGGTGFVTVRSGRTGAEIVGIAGVAGSGFGTALAPIGDVDGDGRADLLVGAPRHRGGANGGFVRIFALPSGALINQYRFTGDNGHFAFGAAIANVGDWDGDGRDDAAVGLPAYSVNAGNRGAILILAPAGTNGLRVAQSWAGELAGDRLGSAMAGIGDLNGDGAPELLAGVPSNVAAGRAHLLQRGRATPLATFVGLAQGDGFGHAVANAGDMNGDGRVDLAVGAPTHDGRRGFVRVFDGRTRAPLFTMAGAAGEAAGWGIAGLGDVDGDGTSDLLVSSPWADSPRTDCGSLAVCIHAPQGTATPFGAGCTGSLGTPVLSAGGSLAIGTVVQLSAATLLPGMPGVLLLGASRSVWHGLPLPLDLSPVGMIGCRLLVSGDVLVPGRAAATYPHWGIAHLRVGIPDLRHLVGQRVYFQYASNDPRPGGLTFTNGIELVVGR